MSKINFTIYYDGPALKDNQMDVRELAPALLSLGKLFEESNRVLNQDKASISVQVKSGFERGCFGVDIQVIQKHLIALFQEQPISTAADLAKILGFIGTTGVGLFWLIKKIKGKKLKKAITMTDGNTNLIFQDIDNLEINIQVSKPTLSLYTDLNVRKEVLNILKPLEKEGIDLFKSKHGEEDIEIVKKEDTKYFTPPEIEEIKETEQYIIKTFSIHSLTFKEEGKWRLSDGEIPFWVKITDTNFLNKIDKNLTSFSKGDRLRVRLKITQWETIEGLKTEYEAVEVLDQKKAAVQIPLPFEDQKEENQK